MQENFKAHVPMHFLYLVPISPPPITSRSIRDLQVYVYADHWFTFFSMYMHMQARRGVKRQADTTTPSGQPSPSSATPPTTSAPAKRLHQAGEETKDGFAWRELLSHECES